MRAGINLRRENNRNRYGEVYCFIIILFSCLAASISLYAQPFHYLVQAEDFQFKGSWYEEDNNNCLGGRILRANGADTNSQGDALTVIRLERKGTYAVWALTPDYADLPSTRLFGVTINGVPLKKAGGHGKTGFAWENLGRINIQEQDVIIRLHNFNYGRCDALLFQKDADINPNGTAARTLLSWKIMPERQDVLNAGKKTFSPYVPLTGKEQALAKIENEFIRVQFVENSKNKKVILCKTEVKIGKDWVHFGNETEDHKVFLLTGDDVSIRFPRYFPSWSTKGNSSPFFEMKRLKYRVGNPGDGLNPFEAGNVSEGVPVSVKYIDQQTIEVKYLTKDGTPMSGFWELKPGSRHINVRLVCQAGKNGFYSMGIAAFQPVEKKDLDNVLMPPVFQYKRVPRQPRMLASSMMQQPLAIVSSGSGGKLLTCFVTAEQDLFKNDWGSVDYSPIGFSIKNQANEIQPVAFAPLMGMEDSKYKSGELIDRKFVIGLIPDTWTTALEYISDSILRVTDYRSQTQSSLTDAVFRMISLISDQEASGWSPGLKGFYDIEGNPQTAPTVVNSSPLTTVALSTLMKDEQFYLTRALPTIEYTLSRNGYRWATDVVRSAWNIDQKALELNPFKSQFTTSYYVGLDRVLYGLNPWLERVALPGDTLRNVVGYATEMLPWSQAFWAYQLTGRSKWLNDARIDANRFVTDKVYSKSTAPLNERPFYNTSFYAPWWDLLDLYEVTKDKKYLEAAIYGSYQTIAGIKSFPKVQEGMQTIHPGNVFTGNTKIWWKGKEQYRLGFPRKEGDAPEKQVPAWLVSPVGLGFEQPFTFFFTFKGARSRPVYMSSWAPHLLRLYQYTKKPIHEIYARNAIIGRFNNYPGYYATGFTDIPMKADFPYVGPDVSSIYYHHIMPHIAFSLDYLVSEMVQRSEGNIQFPYSKQEGFVWFNNRVYGGKPGKIFDDNGAHLWLNEKLIKTNNPEINYLTAVSDSCFWIMLSSESAKEAIVKINYDLLCGATGDITARVYDHRGSIENMDIAGNTFEVKMASKGFKAVAIPLKEKSVQRKLSPLKDGLRVINAGDPWGKVFLFRIRSPFGWDSVFGFAETAPIQDHEVVVSCNGQTVKLNSYPFEWSFYKLGMGEDAHIEMSFKNEQKEIINKKIILKGD